MKKLFLSANKSHTMALSAVIIAGLIVAAAGCTTTVRPIETKANVTGFITEIHTSLEAGLSSQIDLESHADNTVTKYSVTIKDKTLIFQQNAGNVSKVNFSAFKENQWVKIWFSGPVTEDQSPIHATAQQVIINQLKPYQDS